MTKIEHANPCDKSLSLKQAQSFKGPDFAEVRSKPGSQVALGPCSLPLGHYCTDHKCVKISICRKGKVSNHLKSLLAKRLASWK